MVMKYNGYGFSREEQKKFYEDIEKYKEEIKNMDIDDGTKKNLLSQADEVKGAYEKSKIRHLNSKIFRIREENNIKRKEKAKKTIVSRLNEINDNLEHWKKTNVPGKHLMYGDISYN